MAIEVVTKDDLQIFRHQLLDDLKQIIQSNPQEQKEWLKSFEVRKLLKISPGTLQNLRINGTLSYTKIGSIMYYSYEDIEKLLTDNKIESPQKTIPFNFKLHKLSLFPFHREYLLESLYRRSLWIQYN